MAASIGTTICRPRVNRAPLGPKQQPKGERAGGLGRLGEIHLILQRRPILGATATMPPIAPTVPASSGALAVCVNLVSVGAGDSFVVPGRCGRDRLLHRRRACLAIRRRRARGLSIAVTARVESSDCPVGQHTPACRPMARAGLDDRLTLRAGGTALAAGFWNPRNNGVPGDTLPIWRRRGEASDTVVATESVVVARLPAGAVSWGSAPAVALFDATGRAASGGETCGLGAAVPRSLGAGPVVLAETAPLGAADLVAGGAG
jgi:hypothetical protein